MRQSTAIVLIVLLAAVGIASCASPASTVEDQLDPQTGVTVSRASEPLVFYQDGSARAAHARDYVYLGPVQINRMGAYRYYFWLGIWSTLPLEDPAAQRDGFEELTLFADGEPMQLVLAGWNESAIGASEPIYVKPVASAADAYYEISLDQIRLIAEAGSIRLMTSGATPYSYELWGSQSDAQAIIGRFAADHGY